MSKFSYDGYNSITTKVYKYPSLNFTSFQIRASPLKSGDAKPTGLKRKAKAAGLPGFFVPAIVAVFDIFSLYLRYHKSNTGLICIYKGTL